MRGERFGRLHSISGDDDHSTVSAFSSGFCSLFVTDFSVGLIEGTNCEADDIPLLVHQADLLLAGDQKKDEKRSVDNSGNDSCELKLTDDIDDYLEERLQLSGYESDDDEIVDNITKSPHLSIQIISTAILKQLNFFKCSDCKSCFTTAVSPNSIYCETFVDLKHTIERIINIFNSTIEKIFHSGSVSSKLAKKLGLYENISRLRCPNYDHVTDIQ